MAVFVVVHKTIEEPHTGLRTARVVANSASEAAKIVQEQFPYHQILSTEEAKGEIIFEEEPTDLHEKDANGICKLFGWDCPADMATEKPTNPEIIESLGSLIEAAAKQLKIRDSDAAAALREHMTRAMNFGYETAMKDAAAKEKRRVQKQAPQFCHRCDIAMDPKSSDSILEDLEKAGVPKGEQFDALVTTLKTVAGPDQKEGPVDGAPSQREQDLEQENLRMADKLYLMERLIEAQPPFGTDLANFKRRLALLAQA